MAYEATMTGGLIGGAIAFGFWTVTFTGLERRFPGLIGSVGLLALIALCMWLDGWVAAGLGAFCVTFSMLLALGGGGRGPRHAAPAGARPWAFGPMPARGVFAAAPAHQPVGAGPSPHA